MAKSSIVTRKKIVSAFYSIRFAEPPLGSRSLFPLRMALKSSKVTQGNDPPPACPQAEMEIIDQPRQSEDCLYLNIFVPGKLDTKSAGKKLPVMVWIHGGAFIFGSSASHDVSQLAASGNVITVSINYRLGALGFMHTTDDYAPGNMGLHDQSVALKWVHDNIDAFSGDPDSITIFGNSAGGASVGYHMMSHYSRKYFKRGILQSGSPLTLMVAGVDAGPQSVEQLCIKLSCPSTPRSKTGGQFAAFDDKTYKCLREADAMKIAQASYQLINDKKSVSFGPTQDHDFFTNGIHAIEFFNQANGTYSPYNPNHNDRNEWQ